jgi:outer membrane protein assembly factor BamB
VVAIVDRTLVGVRDGAVVWQVLDEVRDWLILNSGVAVVARRERVIAIDPKDGRERWSVGLPPLPDADEFTSTPRAEIATVAHDGLWIGDSEARFFRVHPDRCARNTAKKTAAGCLVAAGALVEETLDEDARLYVDAEGRRALKEFGVVRMFDASWKATLTARAHDHLGAVTLAPAGLMLVIDDDVVLLDPSRCEGEFAPSGWPQPGVLYFKDGDECKGCAAAPPGCRTWRMFVEGVNNEPPIAGDDGAVIVNVDGSTRALRAGETAWQTTTGGGGALLRIGDRVLGVSTGLEENDPLAVFELAIADGVHRWRSPLPISLPGSIFFTDDIVLAHGGGWVIAGYRETIAALRRPE